MRNLDGLTAKQILANHLPEALFSQSLADAKLEYRTLALNWHPDNCKTPGASEVFAHIAYLYKEAVRKQESGTWEEPCQKIEEEESGKKRFRLENGAVKALEYKTSRPFELGNMYIGDHHVIYEVRTEYTDLFHNGRRQIGRLSFKDETMACEMSNYLPQVIDAFRCTNANVLVVRKTPDQLLLADVLEHFGNRIEPIEHVGWILNVLLHIACYFDWSQVTHNAISPETFFISPLRHSGMLLGGWWYACMRGKEMTALPSESLKHIPESIVARKVADSRSDLELIKAIGRTLLGDPIGIKIQFDDSVPRALAECLIMPSLGRAIDDYKNWKYEVLENCFGRPTFIEMSLTSRDLYKEK